MKISDHAAFEAGLVRSTATLYLNKALKSPESLCHKSWQKNSRASLWAAQWSGKTGEVFVMHDSLLDHPFIKHLAAEYGEITVRTNQPDRLRLHQWWHAVDLMMAGDLDGLLESRQLTTTAMICAAVAYVLQNKPGAEVTRMMALLSVLNVTKPVEIRRKARDVFVQPDRTDLAVQQRPMGVVSEQVRAWCWIHACTNGWVTTANGKTEWTERGIFALTGFQGQRPHVAKAA